MDERVNVEEVQQCSKRKILGNYEKVFGHIQAEHFLEDRYLSRVRSLASVLPQLWVLSLSYLAARIIGVKKMNASQFAEQMAETNKKLLDDKEKEDSEKTRRLYDLVIELNTLGIGMCKAVTKEQEILRECLELKKLAVAEHSLDRARAFVDSARKLSRARQNSVQIIVAKCDKQDQIVQLHERLDPIQRKHLLEIVSAITADTLASIDAGKLSPFGSAIVSGHLSAKYAEREVLKASMSTRVLRRGIVTRQRLQERFKAWIASPPMLDLLSWKTDLQQDERDPMG